MANGERSDRRNRVPVAECIEYTGSIDVGDPAGLCGLAYRFPTFAVHFESIYTRK